MSSWGNNPQFDFRKPRPWEGIKSGCTGKKSCPSETVHRPGCLGLKVQLAKFKENRRKYYAEGGFHGRR